VRWYVPENATLFIVGDIDEEETIQQVTRMVKASESLPQKYYVNTR
jgi:predicted Zn-dependent peptidase